MDFYLSTPINRPQIRSFFFFFQGKLPILKAQKQTEVKMKSQKLNNKITLFQSQRKSLFDYEKKQSRIICTDESHTLKSGIFM